MSDSPSTVITLSLEERQKLSFVAAHLKERLGWVTSQDKMPLVAISLSPWLAAFAPDDPDGLTRRLAWDGLSPNDVACVLGDEKTKDLPPADWTETLCAILSESSKLLTETDFPERQLFLKNQESVDALKEPLFWELLIPVLRWARQTLSNRLHRHSWETTVGFSLERDLLHQLSRWSKTAFNERFQTFLKNKPSQNSISADAINHHQDHYKAFVQGMLHGELGQFYQSYPVLAREQVRLATNWVEATVELWSRLEKDRAEILRTLADGQTLGKVTAIEPSLSDPHHGGRRVAKLFFESGLQVVYKPRDLRLELAYNQLLDWLGNAGLTPRPKSLRMVNRRTHGWVESAEQKPLTDVRAARDYYQKAGALVCLTHLLGARDLHMENVIATSDGPVLVDTEMLLQPQTLDDSKPPSETIASSSTSNVLNTGFISIFQLDSNASVMDIGGLKGQGSFKNQPIAADDQPLRPEDFTAQILEGFQSCYYFCLSHREALQEEVVRRFTGANTRIVFRPSNQYAMLLQTLRAVTYQKNGIKKSLMIEAIHRVFHREIKRPLLWPLVEEETEALELLDVPRFLAPVDETTLYARSGEKIVGYLRLSGINAVQERLMQMEEAQLNEQISALGNALTEHPLCRFQTPVPPQNKIESLFFEHACWIGRELLERPVSNTLSLCKENLYQGSFGTALFLAALGRIKKDHGALDTSRELMAGWQRQLDVTTDEEIVGQSIGIGSGIGSWVYGTLATGSFLEDGATFDLARRFARLITPDRIVADRRLDLVSGAAGALLAFLALYRTTKEELWLDRARSCGERLLETRMTLNENTCCWPVGPPENERCLAGFAHGAAGIGYALSQLALFTEASEFVRAALGGYQFERSVFDSKRGNWPVTGVNTAGLRNAHTFMTSWCNGAPGIGLGRTLAADTVQDDEVMSEVQVAAATTGKTPWQPAVDHLCCGIMGRVECLLSIGHRAQSPKLVVQAKALAVKVIERARKMGHFRLTASGFHYPIHDPSLFRGIAGIGYQLLRLSHPTLIPSLLAFELVPSSDEKPSVRRVIKD